MSMQPYARFLRPRALAHLSESPSSSECEAESESAAPSSTPSPLSIASTHSRAHSSDANFVKCRIMDPAVSFLSRSRWMIADTTGSTNPKTAATVASTSTTRR
jgi:hypothetical protein